MSKYLGDFAAGDTIDFKFTTFRPSTGAAFTLGGTPAISVYKDNSTTQTTTGVTLTADFDAVTGLNHVRITTGSDGTFYADGSQFEAVITTGTVDSVSVVGACVGRFTLRAQSALYPTTAGRKLDVNTNGEAGIDWANIGSPSTTVNFSGSTIKAVTDAVTVGTINSDVITASAIATSAAQELADTFWQADKDTKYATGQWGSTTFGRTVLRSSDTHAEVDVNGNNHVSAVVHQMQTGVITDTALDSSAVTEIAQGVLSEATSTNPATYAVGDVGNVLGRLVNMIEADGADFRYTTNALEQAPSGGGGGGGWELNEDQTTGLKRMISAIVGVGGETATPGVLEFDMIGETTTLRITQSTDGNDRLTVEEV